MIERDRETAFAELFRDCYRQLFVYVHALVRNYTDAEDVVQQASLVLWRKFDEYQSGTNFVAWACSVARFEALNFLKQRRRRQAHFSEVFQLRLASVMAGIPAQEMDLRAAALDDCVRKLPEDQRELLRRCFGGTHSVAEVAQEIGRTTHSVYSSLRNIRSKLLACVDQSAAEGVEK
jgi:RNA polymerase sigma-70 factor, ECF subfamily